MELKIVEVNNPNQSATLVAEKISQQLTRRGAFRRVIKRTMEEVMEQGSVYGIKLELSGRLGGAEMSRKEKASMGSIPLSTLQRHIDYGFAKAQTAQGIIGVKVWLDLGLYSEEKTDGLNAKTSKAPQGAKKTYKR